MELRHYWGVLVRRRNVIRNVTLLAILLSVVSVGFTYVTSQWKGAATIEFQVHREKPTTQQLLYDTTAAANADTGKVVTEVQLYTTGLPYLKAVSAALGKIGIDYDYRAVDQNLGVTRASDGNTLIVNWSGSDQGKVTRIVGVAGKLLLDYVPVYQRTFEPGFPGVTAAYANPPDADRLGVTKVVGNVFLRIAVGVVAALVLAFLFEYLDDKIYDETDVEHWLGAPTLAVIPGGRAARPRSA